MSSYDEEKSNESTLCLKKPGSYNIPDQPQHNRPFINGFFYLSWKVIINDY